MKKYALKTSGKTSPSLKIKYEEELNESQLQAVLALNGPVLVIAGAGSGKTRTLVYRVARLVEEGVDPRNVLLLTFTRKSAREMLRRATIVLDERCGNVSGGTFHSFANTTLRRYAKLIGFENNFTILDRSDSEDLVGLIRTNLGYHKRKSRFPKKRAILAAISKAVNKSDSLEDAVMEEFPQFLDNLDEITKIRDGYVKYKRANCVMDYDDLLVHLKTLLEDNDDVRAKLSRYYNHIMVDEYQDTNRLQAHIACLLASEHQNIMVVGDDSQSIYSFRGADFRNIMDFPQIFPETKIITLEQNYRSTQPILDLTNRIISMASEKYSKTLFTEREGEQMPVYIETGSENEQSSFVAQRALELREEGVPLDEIAVLFRAGWHSNDLEVELIARNIPFVKFGGMKFVEAAHVKDVTAHLRVAFNPLDAVSWLRALMLIEGIGPKTATDMIRQIVDAQSGADALESELFSNKRYTSDLLKLHSVLKLISTGDSSPSEQIRALLDYYWPLLEKRYDDFNKRIKDLESLMTIAQRYDGLEQFLTDITLEPIEQTQSDTDPELREEEQLVLSTIHSAKGLEWHTVFVINVIDGFIPSSNSLGSEEGIEEERRLLYVATTRAKENLYLIKPEFEHYGRSYHQWSQIGFSRPSRFLEEGDVLSKYVEKWAVAEEQTDYYDEDPAAPEYDYVALEKIKDYFSD